MNLDLQQRRGSDAAVLAGFLYAAAEKRRIVQRFLFLVFFNAAVPLLQSEEDTARLRGGGKRECGCGEEEARTERGREGDRDRYVPIVHGDRLRSR